MNPCRKLFGTQLANPPLPILYLVVQQYHGYPILTEQEAEHALRAIANRLEAEETQEGDGRADRQGSDLSAGFYVLEIQLQIDDIKASGLSLGTTRKAFDYWRSFESRRATLRESVTDDAKRRGSRANGGWGREALTLSKKIGMCRRMIEQQIKKGPPMPAHRVAKHAR